MEQQSDTTDGVSAVDAEAEEEAPKKKSGLILKVILFVVGLGVGGTLGFTSYERIATMTYDGSATEEGDESAPLEYGEFFEISGIIINPTHSIGQRYLMVNIGLEGNAEAIADIETKEIVIRDMVIRELGQRTTEELADVARRDSMKNDLLTNVNNILQNGKVDRMYFTQYVIQ